MFNEWGSLSAVASMAVIFMIVGVFYSRKQSRSVENYIGAKGTLPVGVATSTIVASGMGAWILFGPAEASSFGGITALLGYSLGSAAPYMVFTYIGPRIRRLMPMGHSLTEYVWFRYGKYMYVSTLIIVICYMSVFLAAELTGIALAVAHVTEIPLWLTASIVAIATIVYTMYGGFRASIFTDTYQTILIIPLIIFVTLVVVTSSGGLGNIFEQIKSTSPALLSLTNLDGLQLGLAVMIAILAANLFHQGYWQRVYACKDDKVVSKAFVLAGIGVIPLIFLAGSLGIIGESSGVVEDRSVAFFAVLPSWIIIFVIVLAVTLVMSSMDTLLNGFVSLFATDLHRLRPNMPTRKLLFWSRNLTILLTIMAMFIASQGYSVLYLFLIADLACAAAVVPVFAGLYSSRLTGRGAMLSLAIGLIVGILFFPSPSFSSWLPFPFTSNLLISFSLAVIMSGLSCIAFSRNRSIFDFRILQDNVVEIYDTKS